MGLWVFRSVICHIMFYILCSVNLNFAFQEELFDALRMLSIEAAGQGKTFLAKVRFSIDNYSVSEYFDQE